MRKTTLLLAAVMIAGLISCSPTSYVLSLQARHPSASGCDLGRKTMAVVYVDSGMDSLFTRTVAEGFAEALEADYFDGDSVIPLYRMEKAPVAVYSSRDTLLNLVLDTSQDVVFLFDTPDYGDVTVKGREPAEVSIPLNLHVYMYDSMDKADTVRSFRGRTIFRQSMNLDKSLSDEKAKAEIWKKADARVVGANAATKFLPVWKDEDYRIYYVPGSSEWEKGAIYSYEFKWREAVEVWMAICDKTYGEKRAMAEYNIAVACHILGEDDLALRWLDKSDADGKVAPSSWLRKVIRKEI